MAPHSSTLAWRIPGMEEPGRLQSMGSLGVRHDWATSLSLFTFRHWRREWQPTPVFLPGESQGRGAWWAAIYGVAQSRTRLKWLSSSSSSSSRILCFFYLVFFCILLDWIFLLFHFNSTMGSLFLSIKRKFKDHHKILLHIVLVNCSLSWNNTVLLQL